MISETINSIIPARSPVTTNLLCNPCWFSLTTPPHHVYPNTSIKTKERVKTALEPPCQHMTDPAVKPKPLRLPNNGQGLASTKWANVKYLRLYILK